MKTPSSLTRLAFVAMTALCLLAGPAQARDDKLMMPIADAMNMPEAKEKLNPNIKFVFNSKSGAKQTFGTYTANRKTKGFKRTPAEACNWAFLSAMIALQDRAVREGGNGVVDIHSYYKKVEHRSSTEFECHDGAFVTGVALRGTVVKF